MTDKNYDFFLQNLDSLCNDYSKKFLSIKDEKIIGIYDSFDEAFAETCKTEELGTFLIQQCVSKEESANYFSWNNVSVCMR